MDQMTTLIFLVFFFFPFKRLNSASYHDCWLNQHREINFINKIENQFIFELFLLPRKKIEFYISVLSSSLTFTGKVNYLMPLLYYLGLRII